MLDSDVLLDTIRDELYTAVVGDIMDTMKLTHQFLPPQVKPIAPDMRVIGYAMPVLEADCIATSGNNRALSQSFGLMLDALDDLKSGEVYLCSGSSPSYALWGELMSTRAMYLGATGAVVNGYARDTDGIITMNFPTFAYGAYAQDQAPRGRVVDYRTSIQIGQVVIKPGDIVFGDNEGVCIIPSESKGEIIEASLEKARGEKTVMKALENGMSARDAFNQYGIL